MLWTGMDNQWLIDVNRCVIFHFQKASRSHVRIQRKNKIQKSKNFLKKKQKSILETQAIVPVAIVN